MTRTYCIAGEIEIFEDDDEPEPQASFDEMSNEEIEDLIAQQIYLERETI